MKKILLSSLLFILIFCTAGCQQSHELSFSEVMTAEIAIASKADRIPFSGFDDYMKAYNEAPQMGYSGAIVRLKPLSRTQYMTIKTEKDGSQSVDGKTMVTIQILEVYHAQDETNVAAGNTFEVGQRYYLQPKTEEGFFKMFEGFGADFEYDSNKQPIAAKMVDGLYEYQAPSADDHSLLIFPNVLPLDENREYYAFLWFKDGNASLGQAVPTSTYDLQTIEEYRDLQMDPDILEVMKGLYEYAEAQ